MKRHDFLEELQNILQRDEKINPSALLVDLEEWDSLSMIATVAFISKSFGIMLTPEDLDKMDTVEDLVRRIGL